MKNITHLQYDLFLPQKALIIYQSAADDKNDMYVEAYDMDKAGKPINAHPLSVQECAALAQALNQTPELSTGFLKPKGLLPETILYINPCQSAFAVWFTPGREASLLFKNELGIPSGTAIVPAMIWKATKHDLYVYAVKDGTKPQENTPLYHAPFFNIYKDGKVCMGTVNVEIDTRCSLEDFISQWEQYFYNSYFSHLIGGFIPAGQNIVQLWQGLIHTQKPFPEKVLVKNGQTLKDILR